MKAKRLPHIVLGVLLPLLLAITSLGHRHSGKEDSDHCDYCATVGANRRRVGATTPIHAEAAGGRPGDPDEVAIRLRRPTEKSSVDIASEVLLARASEASQPREAVVQSGQNPFTALSADFRSTALSSKSSRAPPTLLSI